MKKELFPITYVLTFPLHNKMLPGQLFSQHPTVRGPSFAWLHGINTESFICWTQETSFPAYDPLQNGLCFDPKINVH